MDDKCMDECDEQMMDERIDRLIDGLMMEWPTKAMDGWIFKYQVAGHACLKFMISFLILIFHLEHIEEKPWDGWYGQKDEQTLAAKDSITLAVSSASQHHWSGG